MATRDFLRLVLRSLLSHRLRGGLTALGIGIGIAAVVMLTSLGSGVQKFMVEEFSQFGTTIIAINPGRTHTSGGPAGLFGSTRPLTLEDAEALKRVPHVIGVVPFVMGNAEVEAGTRQRRTAVHGVGSDFHTVFSMNIQIGQPLPDDSGSGARPVAVLGSTLRKELFPEGPVLGQRVRVASEAYRVVGVMESKGQMLGFDFDDGIYIPTARALSLFDKRGLMEIDLFYEEGASAKEVADAAERILVARHGQADFTVTSQEDMLKVLDGIMGVLTSAVAALGGISLFVGAVGILTIMTIAVRERQGEVGLLRALGASTQQVLLLFLAEAVVLSSLGGFAGLLVGIGGAWLVHWVFPIVPVNTPWAYVFAAEFLSAVIGLACGVLPALRAAALDPVVALRAE
ncbi:MAG: ABC transporter permease [Candidatus Binatia bacterium]|nr:ABC transporter permease [Candidatus Binatia bacterium]MDG2011335.1 ABC transporter permease [Candidatus Binatia bacterium]